VRDAQSTAIEPLQHCAELDGSENDQDDGDDTQHYLHDIQAWSAQRTHPQVQLRIDDDVRQSDVGLEVRGKFIEVIGVYFERGQDKGYILALTQ
jgi:hypothetical protein